MSGALKQSVAPASHWRRNKNHQAGNIAQSAKEYEEWHHVAVGDSLNFVARQLHLVLREAILVR